MADCANHTAARFFCQRLSIPYQEALEPYYQMGREAFDKNKRMFTDRTRLMRLQEQYHVFRRWFDAVLAAADEIDRDDDLLLYIAVLYHVLKAQASPSLIPPPDRGRADTDFAPLFALFWFAEDMIADMERRGVEPQIISDTLYAFDAEMNDYYDAMGRPGVRPYIGWFSLFIRHRILRIGRFHFQFDTLDDPIRVYRRGSQIRILADGVMVHRGGMLLGSAGQQDERDAFFAEITGNDGEVSGYAANEWGEADTHRVTLRGYDEILRRGDPVLHVHIPSHDPMSHEVCIASYARAEQTIRKCYPEFAFRAFCCTSWLMEKRIGAIYKKESNIVRFAADYAAYPTCSAAQSVYWSLFHRSKVCPPDELPQDTSLQRAVKQYLCAGGYIYEKGGILLPDLW